MVGELKHLTFDFCGYRLPLFPHHHNCGHPPHAMSERSIELPLADVFLMTTPRESVIEIGAVTPWYWPYRVKDICDPTDPNELVNIRASYLDIDCTGRNILSLSTFEHIGSGEYGLPADPALNQQAFEKLFSEAESFLVTVPGGCNLSMDRYLYSLDLTKHNLSRHVLVRVGGDTNVWEQRSKLIASDFKYEFGCYLLTVLSRRTFLQNGIE